MKLKHILEDLRWIKALWSPFKPFNFKWYVGKTAIGTPYFLPRKWVKATPELAYEAALKEIKRHEDYNKSNPQHAREIKPIGELFQEYMTRQHPVPLKVGFSYCGLGWKTKWTSDDFRHEWNPVFSFVFFGYQIALTIYSKYHSHYWEPWLYYEYTTDKTKSKRERIEQCRKEAPQTWTSYKHNEPPITTDYYTKILKSKWLKD